MNPIEITVPRLQRENIHAITLWPFIFYRKGFQDDIALRCHEFFHWRQAARWGVIPWYLTYLALQLFYFRRAADQHPLEAPAYAEQREVLRLLANEESIGEHLATLRVSTKA
ncbi:MAG: hypothetical protein O2909_10375 [Chloroflexi bacterium]|nr:hypothetical protein [Chloroflexota bacterium]MDA1219834.1 hypothetical protein [Chloroflexota bacterium]PKB57570.1 MAG: hypothetical protein BZY73_02575 [SAR202 cluster bacterium Casp-Chloro-G3]